MRLVRRCSPRYRCIWIMEKRSQYWPLVSRENIYIQSVKVNGQPYDKSYITHRQIMDGATVEFEMGPEPGNIWYR